MGALGASLAAATMMTATWGLEPAHGGLPAHSAVATLAGSACTAATLSPSPASPGATGATVTVTGGSATCSNPTYRFWIWAPGGKWRIVQDYGASNTYRWTIPNTGRTGVYHLEVDVRAAGETVAYDTVANTTYTLNGCTSASISGSPASPVKYDSTVQLTATATCPGTPQFRWWIRRPGEKWQIWQDYGQYVPGFPSRFTWNAGGWGVGTYGIEVDVRDEGSSEVYETVFNSTYDIVETTCSDPGFGAGAVPVVTGLSPTYQFDGIQPVTISGCGFTGTTGVDYWQGALGSVSNVTVVSDSVITANLDLYPWSWPPGKEPGMQIEVDVRVTTPLGASPQQPSDRYSFFWGGAPCSAAGLTASPASPGPTGGTITLRGTTFTCTNPYFRFWIRQPGGTWKIVQDYSQADTFSWTAPRTGLAGKYFLEVDVRDGTDPGAPAYDKVANITYTLSGCTAAWLSANPASPQPHGTAVTLTGSATCLGTPTYRFWVRAPGGSWQIVRDYSTTATFVWTPATAGTYSLEIDVRDQGATATYEGVSNLTYQVT